MHRFHYGADGLCCEDVSLARIAEEVGTPAYVYSEETLERNTRGFDAAFSDVPHLICYAVKANSNLSILKSLANWGIGFEIVSGGELFRVLRVGADPQKIIFDGVGKMLHEIRAALEAGILFFNVESGSELSLIETAAREAGKTARISIRTNPDVDPRTHPYISTGMRKHKFGVGLPEAREMYRAAARSSTLEIVGVTCHIGSQITQMSPFEEALESLRQFVNELRADGVNLKYLDFGGGLGISYNGEEPPSPNQYAKAIAATVRDLGVTVVLEPGRVLVGNAGILLTRVLHRKEQGDKRFLVVDSAMNDLLRPALYGSYHQLWPVAKTANAPEETVDVVGPVCESADFIAQERVIARLEPGALLAVMSAGAYGFSLSSNYNSRPRVAEVMVRGSSFRVVRRRETYADLVRLEEKESLF